MINSILLIAYTINPMGGSEPKIAYNNFRIAQSACQHVHIVTNENLSESLCEFPEISNASNVTVHYVGIPKILARIPTILGDYIRYFAWLQKARTKVKTTADLQKVSLAQHVSWGNLAFGTPLCELNVPYIFGPAGGGTKKLSTGFKIEDLPFEIVELLRTFIMKFLSRTSFTVNSIRNAKVVIATNSDSYEYAVNAGARFIKLSLADSIDKEKITSSRIYPESKNILWAGRFLPRKAPLDAVEAFSKAYKLIPDLTMTMVGNGPLFGKVARRIESYGLTQAIHLQSRVGWEELLKLMFEAKCLLFTSKRDSFGSQILEAAACGTPTVMHSGISALEWIKSPAAIYCDPKDKLASIEDLANALLFCINMNSEEWSKASEAAIAFARENSTEEKAREIIDYYLGIA